MRAFLKADNSLVGGINKIYVTHWGQKRLELVLDDEESGGLSIVDADISEFVIVSGHISTCSN